MRKLLILCFIATGACFSYLVGQEDQMDPRQAVVAVHLDECASDCEEGQQVFAGGLAQITSDNSLRP